MCRMRADRAQLHAPLCKPPHSCGAATAPVTCCLPCRLQIYSERNGKHTQPPVSLRCGPGLGMPAGDMCSCPAGAQLVHSWAAIASAVDLSARYPMAHCPFTWHGTSTCSCARAQLPWSQVAPTQRCTS